jgi:arylsulfatase A-like enzyme
MRTSPRQNSRWSIYKRAGVGCVFAASLGLWAGCGNAPGDGSVSAPKPPNILLVVWDTTRLDRLGIYGADRNTTPFLDEFAKSGLVFDDCRSVAPSTVPSHGSMFTGLLPSEHGANHRNLWLDSSHETLAELLSDGGYATFSFSANPNITEMENFDQGFQEEQHLWDPAWRSRAMADLLLHYQVDGQGHALDNGTGMAKRLREDALLDHEIKGCGALLGEGLTTWLGREQRQDGRPWFAFLNYMEAHYPLQPASEYRERLMDEEQLRRSYFVDRSWPRIWNHVFGFEALPERTVASLDITYDAAIAELDGLFEQLISGLEESGELENTIVILTADHGENLGEGGMLDHRYSMSEALLRAPLVIWAPPGLTDLSPGRTDYPAVNSDLFQTILRAGGVDFPQAGLQPSIDLLAAVALEEQAGDRLRLAEFPNDFEIPGSALAKAPKDWDAGAFARRMVSVVGLGHKLVLSMGGSPDSRLFDLSTDPACEVDLFDTALPIEHELSALAELYSNVAPFRPTQQGGQGQPEKDRLGAIGYGD